MSRHDSPDSTGHAECLRHDIAHWLSAVAWRPATLLGRLRRAWRLRRLSTKLAHGLFAINDMRRMVRLEPMSLDDYMKRTGITTDSEGKD